MSANPPAFPLAVPFPIEGQCIVPGMTLLDYFAGQALCGMVAADPQPIEDDERAAQACYGLAEHMLAERAKRMETTP